MNRDQLAHLLRVACEITDDPEMLVIGSQAILGTYGESELPTEAIRSIEADIAFFADTPEALTNAANEPTKADLVDGAIGELSPFHEMFGVYGQGVSLATAVLPAGWRERVVPFAHADTGRSRAVCLEAHDLVASKLVAGREKDRDFAFALLTGRLIDSSVLRERAHQLETSPVHRRRVLEWIERAERRVGTRVDPPN